VLGAECWGPRVGRVVPQEVGRGRAREGCGVSGVRCLDQAAWFVVDKVVEHELGC
jgi:hypothetical protein